MEGVGTELASQGGQGEDHGGQTVAKGNDDEAEMDCLAIAKLDLCLQSAGRQPFAKAKMKSVNSGD